MRLSVVVQGPVLEVTTSTLSSVREVLPDAQLVLATYEGQPTRGLDFDELVLVDDPGPFRWALGYGYNVARMIASSRAGLAKAEEEYTLRIRSDSWLIDDGFFPISQLYFTRKSHWSGSTRLFERRVVIPTAVTRDPRKGYVMHPSDVAQFGLTSDLKRLWHKAEPLAGFTAEQSVLLPSLPERAHMQHGSESSDWLVRMTEQLLVDDFIVVTLGDMGIGCLREPVWESQSGMNYTFERWLKTYKDYCAEEMRTREAHQECLDL